MSDFSFKMSDFSFNLCFGKLKVYHNLIIFVAPSNEHFVIYCGRDTKDAEHTFIAITHCFISEKLVIKLRG